MDGVPFLFNYSFRGLHSPDPFPESMPGLHSRTPGSGKQKPRQRELSGFMRI